MDGDDVGGRGLNSHSCPEEGGAEVTHIGLVSRPQLAPLLRPEQVLE